MRYSTETSSEFSSSPIATQNIPHKFVQLGKVIVIPIDKDLVKRYRITEDDWVVQVAAENGGIFMKFSNRK